MKKITDLIPHREPFLLVDEIIAFEGEQLIARKLFTGEEYFFPGHYPGFPIVPGVLLCEAAMQAGAALLGLIHSAGPNNTLPVVAKMGEVKFRQMVKPGDEIMIDVRIKERMSAIIFLQAKITKSDKIVLQFEFACAFTDKP